MHVAYIAGIIDGEGCIAIGKHKTRAYKSGYQVCPRLSVTNTNLKLLKDLRKVTGVGNITSFERKKNPNWKIGYTWQVFGKDINKVLVTVLPYLRLKQRQAKLVIRFINKF